MPTTLITKGTRFPVRGQYWSVDPYTDEKNNEFQAWKYIQFDHGLYIDIFLRPKSGSRGRADQGRAGQAGCTNT